ncbi:MAG: hypothetical protein JW969_02390 [Spirochaetales bacterium]|nr:hypothetical protein [Spirochaetales bacterium]
MAYKSRITVFGIPLICVSGSEPAVGFIAIGQFAYGFFTLGQFGIGLIFGIGQFMGGFLSIAQFSFGPLLSIGQFSVGWYSIGMFSFGYEGLHMIGYHFLENNFLDGIIRDGDSIFDLLIRVVIFTVLTIFITIFLRSIYKGAKRILKKILKAIDTTGEKSAKKKSESGKGKIIYNTAVLLAGMLLAWQIMNWAGMNQFFDEVKYERISMIGKGGTAEILEVKEPFLQLSEDEILLLVIMVYPTNTEITPYRAEMVIPLDKKSPDPGMQIKIKYDPQNLSDIVLDNSS